MWRLKGAFIINEKNGKVLDIQGGLDAENRNILVWNKHGKINQQWDIIYADDMKPEPKVGELNEDFGLIVGKDFHIVSAMSKHLYLDLISNRNMVVKTSNGRKSQIWYFDQKTLTIKTRANNQSFDIQGSGKQTNMQVWSTNSRWW